MADASIDSRYLELFPAWLRSLGEDAAALGEALAALPRDDAARSVASGLNYIFKSLDLIPDGIDDLGFLDDAFVVRIACALGGGKDGVVGRLANEAEDVKAFLGDDYARLEAYVRGLRKGAARGRTVEDIMTDEEARSSFLQEVDAWGKAYQVPSFNRDIKTLIKLKAFLSAKLA
jgi:uncharacterized membrane protein YkvA (DUF1232 family)